MFQMAESPGELLNGVKKVRYSHDAMVDAIIANPAIRQRELAALFGYTEGWVSQVLSSDSFQARLDARKAELVDPEIVKSVDVQLKGVARQALEVVSEKLTASKSPELALRALDISTRALGYGIRNQANAVGVVQNFVVALPPKSPDGATWIQDYSPRPPGAQPQAGVSAALPAPDMDLVLPVQPLTNSDHLPRATLGEFEGMIEMAAAAALCGPALPGGVDDTEE